MSVPVLYVDDSPDDIFFVDRAFRTIAPGVQLRIIANGQAAADYFDPNILSDPPPESLALALLDLALLDLNLPGRSGLEVLRQIRKKSRTPALPVVIFSASNQRKDIDACYAEGCNAYLIKPTDSEGLRKLVAVVADTWLKVPPGQPAPVLPRPN